MLVNKLLKRISNLEFEVEKLEKNEMYKCINGVAYFRQDYVLGREKETERLHSIIKEVREYIKYNMEKYIDYELTIEPEEILYILDKENENEQSNNL